MDWDRLLAAAALARSHAYAPFSRFAVGAALAAPGDAIFAGCNVENRSYGATLCAERTAVGCAVAAGQREFSALVILADADPLATPCGICRETLAEFCSPDLPILLAAPDGRRRETRLGDLFPEVFRLPPGRNS